MARSSFPLPNTAKPINGGVALPINFSFDVGGVASQNADLNAEMQANQIDFVQSIWIDNSANANPVTLIFAGMAQRIIVKKNHQGIYPLLIPQGPCGFSIATTLAAGLIVPVILFNVQIPQANWDTV